jgi:DNA-binding MarR family transcriptional regulator
MSDLAMMASGSLSRLSHALGRLEARGWVERRPVGVGRRVDVVLTDAGAAANAAAAAAHVREARRLVIDALTRQQLVRLGQSARAIVAAIDADVAAVIDDTTRRATER